jgi:hypothetical protein
LIGNYSSPFQFGFQFYEKVTKTLCENVVMISDDEQDLFENARQHVADAVSTLVADGPHPALVCAAILSEVSFVISGKDFWGDERPCRRDFQGYWNLLWRLQEKAFTELADNMSAPTL